MKAVFVLAALVIVPIFAVAQNEPLQPLVLVKTIEIPDVPLGPYADHPTVDVKARRVYATTQAHKSVKVFDLDSGRELHDILGIKNPHSVFLRPDLDTVFITDGGVGELKVYRGHDYELHKTIKLELNADGTRYDPETKLLYVANGGKDNLPIALDERHHRLFVGCRNTEQSGAIIVIDTRTGKEIDSLPITGWVDELAYDTKRKRIYASCGKGPDGVGSLFAFQEDDSGNYRLAGNPATAPMAKAGTFVPELDLFVVDVPHNELTTSKVLIFKVQ